MIVSHEIKVKDKLDDITRELASADDDVQAEFFNKFFGQLYSQCEGMHEHQLRCIRAHLSSNSKELVKILCS